MGRNYRYMETGVCALCGAAVRLDEHEGRVVCEGCSRPTDNCTCLKDDLDTRHESSMKIGAMRPGTSGQWIADPQPDPEDDYPDD